LQGESRNDFVWYAGIERSVAAPVRIEPGEICAQEAFDRGELSANDHLAVGLQRDGARRSIHAQAGIERQVHISSRAKGVKTERAELQQETDGEKDCSDKVGLFHNVIRVETPSKISLVLRHGCY